MKNNQQGGIVSFVIVAVALTGLLAGGLYLSKQQARVARDTDTSTPLVSDVKKDLATDKKPEQKTTTPSTQTTPATPATPATPTTPAPKTSPTNTPATPKPSTDRVATTGPSEPLPSTGPGDTAFVTITLGVLAFTGYRLMQSRWAMHLAALRRPR